MSQARFRLHRDLLEALDQVVGSKVMTAEPVVLLAGYLYDLAESYGLSESDQIAEDPLQRVDTPVPAVDLLRHYLAGGSEFADVDLRNRLYAALVEISQDPLARKALNKTQALTDVEVLRVAQIYWNLEGNEDRPLLPIRPGQISRNGRTVKGDIPTEDADDDFATMKITDRRNTKASYKATGHSFAKQGARLAALTARHIIATSAGSAPRVDGALLRRTETEIAIVWGDPDGPDAPIHPPIAKNSERSTWISPITSRARAYHAIDSLEQDLRSAIEQHLLGRIPPEEAFGPDYERLNARRASADLVGTDSLTMYLYPQEAYDALLRHPAALPAELGELLQSNFAAFDAFLPVRNRVMRGRPLQPNDLEETGAFVERFRSEAFGLTNRALEGLGRDSGWQPRRRPGSEPPEPVSHNLPDADFNETGLLGRDQQIDEVVAKIKGRRTPITLIGEGGIGKTALALEVCYRLVDEPEPVFSTVLWTSLKTEQLTPSGVQALTDSLRDIDGVTRALGREIDDTFQGGAEELAQLLGDRSTLVIIDNLETVRGVEVLSLWEVLPSTVTFLFTSRVGLGQLDRPVEVGPLDEPSAEQLFRMFASTSGVTALARTPSTKLSDILRELRYSPLAIRWYILSVEAGKTPTDVLRNQDELLQFCVANVVDALGKDERVLLDVLRVLDRPVSFDELAVISELDIDTLHRGAQQLTQRSLLVRSQVAAALDEAELLALSSTARAFLPTVSESAMMEDIFRREVAYKKDRDYERKWLADHGLYFDPNMIFPRSTSDEPVQHLLRRALRANKAGDPAATAAAMARARALNPGYFEVDRIDAFFASIRKAAATATTLYRSALNNCRTEEERCWVSYFYAAHLARDAGEARDIPEAIRLADAAHACFDTHETAHHLGQYYFWDNRHDDGRRLIEWSIERSPTAEFTRKATTSLVECFRQWGDADLAVGAPSTALERVLRGLAIGMELHESGSTDEKLMRSIVRAANSAMNAVHRLPELDFEQETELAQYLQRLTGDGAFQTTDSWRNLEYSVSFLSDDRRARLAPGIASPTIDAAPKERVRGTVVNLGPKYGFIAHRDFPNNVFFQAGWLVPPTRIDELAVGSIVEFTPGKNDKGQAQAEHVTLCPVNGDEARQRA